MLPLVSVFVEAYDRADCFQTTLDSIVNQTYKNIEIIVIDRSLNTSCKKIAQSYLEKHPHIQYYKSDSLFQNRDILEQLLKISSGEYITYATDDDIYHKDRINIMMNYFLKYEDLSCITSYRKLIDINGNLLDDIHINRKIFEQNSMLDGKLFIHLILKKLFDIIDEMSIPLFKRKAIEDDILKGKFGIYEEIKDNSIANFLALLNVIDKTKIIYLSDSLSYFKVHDIQDQRKSNSLLHKVLAYLISKNDSTYNKE